MYSMVLFKVRPSYISGTMRRSTPWARACVQNILDDAALAGRGEEDLIHKLRARVLEERIERAHHVAGGCRKAGTGA